MRYEVLTSFIDSKQQRFSPGDIIDGDDYSASTIKHYRQHKMIELKADKAEKSKVVAPKVNKSIKPEANK